MKAVIIIPAAVKARAETELAKDFPNGGRECFGPRLSITGAEPATHHVVCPIVNADVLARIKAKFAAVAGSSVSSYDPDSTPNGAMRAIASAGLKLIPSPI